MIFWPEIWQGRAENELLNQNGSFMYILRFLTLRFISLIKECLGFCTSLQRSFSEISIFCLIMLMPAKFAQNAPSCYFIPLKHCHPLDL